MVERSLSMREVPGSIPGASKVFQFAYIFACMRMEMDGFYDISCLRLTVPKSVDCNNSVGI